MIHGSIFDRRLQEFRRRLGQGDADGAWITEPNNRRYLSGFRAGDGQCNESSGSLFITQNRALLTTDSRYETEARNQARGYEVVTLKKGLVEEIREVVANLGARHIGFEAGHVTCSLHGDVQKKLRRVAPRVRLSPLPGILEDMRELKDGAELRAIAAAARMMSDILEAVVAELKPGLTEKQAAWRIEDLAREAGADGLSFPPIVASGPNGALPHAVPTDRRLRPGEPVVLDVGVRVKGYCSDMTRTVFLGEPAPRFRKIYLVVREAQLAALNEIRAGVASTHPDAVARTVIADAGYGEYFGHALGHGVGLATHERPRLGPLRPTTLKPGMVVTVEPGIYLPGKGGVRLEEMVVVKNGGARVLTKDTCFYDFGS